MNSWVLPTSVCVGGKDYPVCTDYRDIIEIMRYLDDVEKPLYLRWDIALSLFYDTVPDDREEAMKAMSDFISEGEEEKQGQKLLDWDQDARAIIADVNKVAGKEIRSVPYLHWWTFLSYFRAIGEGQLSTLVGIRNKLRKGRKLEKWEQEFYRENRSAVDFKKKYTAEEEEEKERLLKMLDG